MICDLRCSVLFLCLYSSLKETRRGKNIHFFSLSLSLFRYAKGKPWTVSSLLRRIYSKVSESFDSFFRRSESFRKGDGALWNFENVVKIYRYFANSYHVSFNIVSNIIEHQFNTYPSMSFPFEITKFIDSSGKKKKVIEVFSNLPQRIKTVALKRF